MDSQGKKKGNLPPPILTSEKEPHQSLAFDVDKALDIINDLSEKLISVSPEDFIQMIPEKACELIGVPIGILWRFDEKERKFRVAAASSEVDEEYRKSELDLNYQTISQLVKKNKVLAIADIKNSSVQLSHIDELNARKWVSLLTIPLKIEDRIIGILSVLGKELYVFEDWQKKILTRLANYTKLSIQREEITSDRNKLQNLSNVMLEVTKATEQNELWNLLQKGTLELVNSTYVWISTLDHYTGELKIVTNSQPYTKDPKIKFGEGITGKALEEEKPQKADDVLSEPWKNIYIERWEITRSELAIPILIDKLSIREETEVKLGTKVIGVLNIESPNTKAFSETDQERLVLLARCAAMRFERLELDRKLQKLRQVETELTKPKSYKEIIDIIIDSMTKILGFEWVNISLINKEKTLIKSEYIVMESWPKEKIDQFKIMAVHSLNSHDIQADIVKTKEIEVPGENDSRFDPKIFEEFNHENLVRVFLPMIYSLNNQVIGTVEVGYNRKYRKYISEQDVQILKGFVDYAVHALTRKKSGFIDKIAHELKSPIVGIRNNANYVKKRITILEPEKTEIKVDDILVDCDLLLYQVRQLEYFMGRSAFQKPKLERTLIFQDVIIKTINQIRPTIKEDYGLAVDNIRYNSDFFTRRIQVVTDKNMFNQVIFNLLINAVKYAKKDSKEFKIEIEVTEKEEKVTIKFRDWGMGIKEEDRNNIFQEGFRSREAITRATGSGLGLAISKAIMKELGGELKLNTISNPTEFEIILPKILKIVKDIR